MINFTLYKYQIFHIMEQKQKLVKMATDFIDINLVGQLFMNPESKGPFKVLAPEWFSKLYDDLVEIYTHLNWSLKIEHVEQSVSKLNDEVVKLNACLFTFTKN